MISEGIEINKLLFWIVVVLGFEGGDVGLGIQILCCDTTVVTCDREWKDTRQTNKDIHDTFSLSHNLQSFGYLPIIRIVKLHQIDKLNKNQLN